MTIKRLVLAALAAFLLAAAPAPAGETAPVVASGTVPDEATRAALIARLKEVYRADRVVDQLAVGSVSAPPGWSEAVRRLVATDLKLISHGQLKVDGNTVAVRGEVASDAHRQQVAARMAASLDPSYTVSDGLRVAAQDQQVLDSALANRIIEFESGQATLTESGKAILDQMAAAMQQVKGKRVQVAGHTDNVGSRASNLALSQARAQAVVAYIQSKGIPADRMTAAGEGPDRPVADNSTAEGRARNRRIEFRIAD
ncbi:OmpA family protein [Massilia arenosa]|uniref:OmpA family protein n=1 Tax=Zemynaea arenosa TaxID=2561931 RepID=A0A4Y9SGR7_9BURK|nr:OmpA family protein [Massilia arenosa]TFW23170.1 OmpA family protein [Massilia arenosa]